MNVLTIGNFPPLGYAAAEAINTLCTNLSFSGEHVKKIMVTSCHAEEGKSYLSMNIMRTMAKFGKTVALVDADLRRSVITAKYDLQFPNPDKKLGLAHYLAGKVGMEEVVYPTNVEGTLLVPVGRDVSNPLPLLNSQRFSQLLDALAAQMDYVIVDVPPVGTVIDGAQIAKSCDGTLIVVNYNSVGHKELLDVKEQLEQTECPILGTVLNMVEYDNYLSRKYYYRSYYHSHYKYYGNQHTDHSGKHEKDGKGKK